MMNEINKELNENMQNNCDVYKRCLIFQIIVSETFFDLSVHFSIYLSCVFFQNMLLFSASHYIASGLRHKLGPISVQEAANSILGLAKEESQHKHPLPIQMHIMQNYEYYRSRLEIELEKRIHEKKKTQERESLKSTKNLTFGKDLKSRSVKAAEDKDIQEIRLKSSENQSIFV